MDQSSSGTNNGAGDTTTTLEQKQALLAHHVRLVGRGMSHALLVYSGQGGIGKTRTILRTLESEGVTQILVNSHITPLALFSTLYWHRTDKVLFFDDVDSIFASMPHLGLLRSALWGNPRVVTYGSSQLPDDLPSSFVFESRVIFCVNVLPKKNDAFKAVVTRCDTFQLDASQDEILDLMRSVAREGHGTLSPEDCLMVVDFIADHADDRQLSLRLLEPSLQKLIYARHEGLDWRPLVKSQLQFLGKRPPMVAKQESKANELKALNEAVHRHPTSVSEQQACWSKITGKSRASFYRLVARQRLSTPAAK